MDKRPGTIGNMFDRIAPTYDRLNILLSLSIDRLWRQLTIRKLGLEDGDKVLDIATGTGDLALCALKRESCSVVGLDLAHEMLVRADKKKEKNQGLRYTLVQADGLTTPFADETFDKAMIAFGIRNVLDIKTFLKETNRILKKDGRFAVLEFSLPPNPLVREIYLFYFQKILPLIGGIVSGDFKAYKYLRDSVMDFPSPEKMEKLMRENGFVILYSAPILLGISHLYVLGKA